MNSSVVRRIEYYLMRHVDGALLGVVLALMLVGLLVMANAHSTPSAISMFAN